jgi:thymidylate synthase (FAD)
MCNYLNSSMTDLSKPIWPRWTADDGIGSIEVLDVFGNDLTVVNAARVSFAKESTEFDGKDEKLIKYLAKHRHNSPFFHPQIRIRLKMPIFMAREWFRHTVGFSRNEVSRRYVDSKPELWIPTIKDLRARDANLKQGSKNTVVENADKIADSLRLVSEKSIEMYESLLSMNVAPEIARVMLPQSMYTEFIETASLAAYARLIGLRTDPTAQKEIRMYADVLSALLEVFFPVSLPALLQTGSI